MLPLPVQKLFKKQIWKLDGDTPQTLWMKYGLESESAAVKQYEIQTSLLFHQLGYGSIHSFHTLPVVLMG